MDALRNYLHTDWAAMTVNDWIGLTLTIVTFIGMLAGYIMVFNPKNKESFEARRNLPLDNDEQLNAGDKR